MARPTTKRQAPTPAEEERKRRDDAIRHVHLASESRRSRALRPKPPDPAPAVRKPVLALDAVTQATASAVDATKLAARMLLRQEGCSVCPYDEAGLIGKCCHGAQCTLPKMCQIQGCSDDCGAIHGLRPLCHTLLAFRPCEEDGHNHDQLQSSRVRVAFARHTKKNYGVARTVSPEEQ
ncbi:hypothetical protein LTR27_012777 [Elasticomyces elasticus]|nr:hypothetical protein LTR27_012777 [Elasticomyces elasticus]